MSGSGQEHSASGGGGGYLSVGGITVDIPAVDPSIRYVQEIQDISLCIAIVQMTSYIENSPKMTNLQIAFKQRIMPIDKSMEAPDFMQN